MAQEGFISCPGCGATFNRDESEDNQMRAHECTDDMEIPMLADVTAVRLAITCESILDDRRGEDADDYARTAAKHYAAKLADVIGWEHVDVTEDAEDSEYDSEWTAYHVSCFVDVTPDEWVKIADAYCLDLDWSEWSEEERAATGSGRHKLTDHTDIPAIPVDYVPTLGILGVDGITPAVAIEGTDQGWGDNSGEPILIASFYVALMLKGDDAD